eukprot:comp17568_c0_seq1/m.29911 comp17568_c0_seq1/g.29911  ORF comp17568_c0_seq1/g.29911 comp17568_c0_seq1/m.29911 type:complete len:112 (+) comp17568_c0_seq1:26-361(+)
MEFESHVPPASTVSVNFDNGDRTTGTFVMGHADHTLGNSLRYMLIRTPEVTFCGYSVPHPLEPKLNLRIQTSSNSDSVAVLRSAIGNLKKLTKEVEAVFDAKVTEHNQKQK